MIKTLIRHGSNLMLVIEQPILDMLKIDEKTPLEITTDGQRIIVSPAAGTNPRDQKFRKALEKTNTRYGKALEKLAE